jgi:hypothetical protein
MDLTFDEWIAYGIEKGWCGPPVCYTHDGLPTTNEEFESDDIDAFCIHVVRMYEDHAMKENVEQNHSPSTWRNNYTIGF